MGFIIFTILLTVVLFLKDRKKTVAGLKKGIKKLMKILPVFLMMLVFVAIVLTLIPESLISRYLGGDNSTLAALIGLALGSVAVMPGFVAFPLGSVLRDQGVLYLVIAAFTTSLMMVGILTFPVERQYFGARFALLRNISALASAGLIALVVGIVFGEIG